MRFTYKSYSELLELLKKEEYNCCSFAEYSKNEEEKTAILRHDIDLSTEKAEKMAGIEWNMGVTSTYFVMISSAFYNILEKSNEKNLHNIIKLNQEIGLHYDETKYGYHLTDEEIIDSIKREIICLEKILGQKVKSVSMHIPDKRLFGYKLEIGKDIVNAYDPDFTQNFKYVSDSMMRWREPVLEIVKSGKYKRIQILTHPIWYNDIENQKAKEIIRSEENNKRKDMECYLDLIMPGYHE